MILGIICQSRVNVMSEERNVWNIAYHRFVNTTPNPRATKKSKGELVGLELLSPELPSASVLVGGELVVVGDISTGKCDSSRSETRWYV